MPGTSRYKFRPGKTRVQEKPAAIRSNGGRLPNLQARPPA